MAAAVAVGFLSCALLVANNLRDIPTDEVAGKRTLAVRLGDARTRWLYVAFVVGAFVVGVGCAVVAVGGRRLPRWRCRSRSSRSGGS